MLLRTSLFVVLIAVATPSPAGQGNDAPKRWFSGMTEADADGLIAKIRQAQNDLRSGKGVWFELLSGAPASYEMNNVSPRDSFLNLDLSKATHFKFRNSGNPLWQPYEISVFDGPIDRSGRSKW